MGMVCSAELHLFMHYTPCLYTVAHNIKHDCA